MQTGLGGEGEDGEEGGDYDGCGGDGHFFQVWEVDCVWGEGGGEGGSDVFESDVGEVWRFFEYGKELG